MTNVFSEKFSYAIRKEENLFILKLQEWVNTATVSTIISVFWGRGEAGMELRARGFAVCMHDNLSGDFTSERGYKPMCLIGVSVLVAPSPLWCLSNKDMSSADLMGSCPVLS